MEIERMPQEFPGRVIKNGPHPNFPDGNGRQVIVRFDNGYGASIIYNKYSYGLEMAVLEFSDESDESWGLTYDTPVTNDVLGWLDAESLAQALADVEALPPRQAALDGSTPGELPSL